MLNQQLADFVMAEVRELCSEHNIPFPKGHSISVEEYEAVFDFVIGDGIEIDNALNIHFEKIHTQELRDRLLLTVLGEACVRAKKKFVDDKDGWPAIEKEALKLVFDYFPDAHVVEGEDGWLKLYCPKEGWKSEAEVHVKMGLTPFWSEYKVVSRLCDLWFVDFILSIDL